MAKLDKSLYTKEEWRAMQAQRNYDKSVHRAMKSGTNRVRFQKE